jgi:hypothetical protein
MFSLLSFGYGYEVSLLSFLIGSGLIVRSTCVSSMYSSTHNRWVAAADSQSSAEPRIKFRQLMQLYLPLQKV